MLLRDDSTPEAEIIRLNRYTPQQIADSRKRLLEDAPPPLVPPAGKTLNDLLVGQWQGMETDEEIMAALRKLF